MRGVPFVDAHFHLWKLDRLDYPWLTPPFGSSGPNGSVEAIAQDYLVADYREELAGWNVVAAVHVEAGADPRQTVEETMWLEEVAAADGLPSAIVAHAALDDPDVERVLERQAAFGRVRGIRHIVNWHEDADRTYTRRDVTGDDAWRQGFAALARHGLSFDLQCYPSQMVGLAPLLDLNPDVPVVLNHLGMPVLGDEGGFERWRTGIRALAAVPSTSMKFSGLGFIDRTWTYEGVLPFMEEALEAFGPRRCMFASDAPTDRLFAPLGRCLEAYRRFSAALSEDERLDMWCRNAARIYRVALPEGSLNA